MTLWRRKAVSLTVRGKLFKEGRVEERCLEGDRPQRVVDAVMAGHGPRWVCRLAAGVSALVVGYTAAFGAVFGALVGTNCVLGCAPPTALDVAMGGSIILTGAVAGAGAAVLAVVAVGRPCWKRIAAGIGVVSCVAVALAMAVLSLAG